MSFPARTLLLALLAAAPVAGMAADAPADSTAPVPADKPAAKPAIAVKASTKAATGKATSNKAGKADAAPVAVPLDDAGFAKYVSGLFTQDKGLPVPVQTGPLAFDLGEIKLDLAALKQSCVKTPEKCDANVHNYVKGASQYYVNRHFAPAKAAVRLVLRTPGYLDDIRKNRPAGDAALQPRPFLEGLIMLPVLNSAHAVRMLDEKDNATLGISADEAFALGMVNLTATLKPLMDVAKPVPTGQVGRIDGDFFNGGRLVLHDSWAPLAEAQGGQLIVVPATSDIVLYASDDKPDTLKALRQSAADAMKASKWPVSDMLLRWTKSGWDVIH